MSASSFVNREPVWRNMANGHLNTQLPTLIFLVPFLAGLGLLTVIAKFVVRFSQGLWMLSRRQMQVVAVLAGC